MVRVRHPLEPDILRLLGCLLLIAIRSITPIHPGIINVTVITGGVNTERIGSKEIPVLIQVVTMISIAIYPMARILTLNTLMMACLLGKQYTMLGKMPLTEASQYL